MIDVAKQPDDSTPLIELRVTHVPQQELPLYLGYHEAPAFEPRDIPLAQLRMEIDDAPILSYIIKNHQPKRHLEFGTLEGASAVHVLQNCSATVWSLNLLEGEHKPDGDFNYGMTVDDWGQDGGVDEKWQFVEYRAGESENIKYVKTDGFGMIGHLVHENNLSDRFVQIHSDSRLWDSRRYPAGWFDSALIDGSHEPDVVVSDTRKVLKLVRSEGVILWHDFCPEPEVYSEMASCRGVVAGLDSIWPEIEEACSQVFWIENTWLLLGVVR